jgi:agmatine deiminase
MPGSAFRLPAEWEQQDCVWLCWPQNPRDWPGKFSPIAHVYAEIVRKLAAHGRVRLIVGGLAAKRRAETLLRKARADLEAVSFHIAATDRGWTRDFLPLFALTRQGEVTALDFAFTGWAKYADHVRDQAASAALMRELGLPVVVPRHKGGRVVLEGGAIDVNGAGALLATEECLLDPAVQVRNPGFGRRDYEDVFAACLGARQVLWLGRGIAGDDTHGHVDDLCRFVAPDTVVLCREDDPGDANHAALRDNRERLEGVVLEGGAKLRVVDLPMPRPLYFDGQRLPASYANFLIAGGVVLVPTFNDPADRTALGLLAELFPGREVAGIHAVDLVWGLGTLHCLSHEQPQARPAKENAT